MKKAIKKFIKVSVELIFFPNAKRFSISLAIFVLISIAVFTVQYGISFNASKASKLKFQIKSRDMDYKVLKTEFEYLGSNERVAKLFDLYLTDTYVNKNRSKWIDVEQIEINQNAINKKADTI